MSDPANPDSPSFMDRIENAASAQIDREREMHAEGIDRTMYDVQAGVAKGAYGFGKGLVTGVIDLAVLGAKLGTGDPETYGKIWNFVKEDAKNEYIMNFGSQEEKEQLLKQQSEKAQKMYDGIKKQVLSDWDEAKKNGKQAELISKWSTRGVLEVASFFVGAGEVKAAAGAAKIGEAAKDLDQVVNIASKAKVACESTEAAKLAAQAEKAAEVASATKGKNVVRWFKDANGRTVRAEAELRESFAGLSRSAADVKAQKAAADLGKEGDVGGHMVGHRFVGDLGDEAKINLFPQEANFNNSAYKTMENEIADWTKNGKQVNLTVEVHPPGAARPDVVKVQYDVIDPSTGKTVYSNQDKFSNQSGQVFDRVSAKDMANY